MSMCKYLRQAEKHLRRARRVIAAPTTAHKRSVCVSLTTQVSHV